MRSTAGPMEVQVTITSSVPILNDASAKVMSASIVGWRTLPASIVSLIIDSLMIWVTLTSGSRSRQSGVKICTIMGAVWMRQILRGVMLASSKPTPGDDGLALLAELRDAESHGVARGKIDRLRLAAHPDARRGARGDDVAGLEGHEAADVTDDLGNGEDHRAGVACLHALSVDVEPHVEVLHVTDLVAGHEPRAHGTEGIAALALVPGAA